MGDGVHQAQIPQFMSRAFKRSWPAWRLGQCGHSYLGRESGYVTLKFLMLVAVPAAVVTKMGPVSAPVSTLVTTRVAVSDTMVAAVPPKLTLVARPG